MKRRVARLLEEDVPLEKVLAVTFMHAPRWRHCQRLNDGPMALEQLEVAAVFRRPIRHIICSYGVLGV